MTSLIRRVEQGDAATRRWKQELVERDFKENPFPWRAWHESLKRQRPESDRNLHTSFRMSQLAALSVTTALFTSIDTPWSLAVPRTRLGGNDGTISTAVAATPLNSSSPSSSPASDSGDAITLAEVSNRGSTGDISEAGLRRLPIMSSQFPLCIPSRIARTRESRMVPRPPVGARGSRLPREEAQGAFSKGEKISFLPGEVSALSCNLPGKKPSGLVGLSNGNLMVFDLMAGHSFRLNEYRGRIPKRPWGIVTPEAILDHVAATRCIHPKVIFPHATGVPVAEFVPVRDNLVLSATNSGQVAVWDVNRSQQPPMQKGQLPSGARCGVMAGPVSYIGLATGAVARVDLRQRLTNRKFEQVCHSLKPGQSHIADITALALPPSSDNEPYLMVSGGRDGTVRVWDVRQMSRQLIQLLEPSGYQGSPAGLSTESQPAAHRSSVRSIAFNPTGDLLVTKGTELRDTRLWSPARSFASVPISCEVRALTSSKEPPGTAHLEIDWMPPELLPKELARVGIICCGGPGGGVHLVELASGRTMQRLTDHLSPYAGSLTERLDPLGNLGPRTISASVGMRCRWVNSGGMWQLLVADGAGEVFVYESAANRLDLIEGLFRYVHCE